MNKTIEKCEAYKRRVVEAALTKAKEEYDEADASYRNTGYDRYFNKMNRLEKEIEELTEYQKGESTIAEAKNKEMRIRAEIDEIKKTLKNKLFYLEKAVPFCSELRSLSEYVERL